MKQNRQNEPEDIIDSLLPLLKNRRYEEAEKKLVDLLRVILARNEVVLSFNPQQEEDAKTLRRLWFSFDGYYNSWIEETFAQKIPLDNEFDNKTLLQCCHDPKLMKKILLELSNYLSIKKTHFFPYRNLHKALEAYSNKQETIDLDEENRIHLDYSEDCERCRSFSKEIDLFPEDILLL